MPIVSAPSFGVRIFYRQGLPVVSKFFLFFSALGKNDPISLAHIFQPPIRWSIGKKPFSIAEQLRSWRNMWVSHQVFPLTLEEWEKTREKTEPANIHSFSWQISNKESLLCKAGGESKTDLIFGEEKISSCKEARCLKKRAIFSTKILVSAPSLWIDGINCCSVLPFFLNTPGVGVFLLKMGAGNRRVAFLAAKTDPPRRFNEKFQASRFVDSGGVSLRADGLRSWELVPLGKHYVWTKKIGQWKVIK